MQIALAIVIALISGLAAGPVIIRKLKEYRQGQMIRQDGPVEHYKKQGTPTMGGLIFIVGILVSYLIMNLIYPPSGDLLRVLWPVIGLLLFGLIGFVDDRAKIRKHQSEGLTARQKIGLNVLFAVGIAYVMNQTLAPFVLKVPLLNQTLTLGTVLYFLFMIVFFTSVTNSVNLADGIDGLCGSVSLIVAVFYILYGVKRGDPAVILFASALAGALAAYLFFNWHPARVFMGDVGSFALGGALATLAVMTQTELLFILVGLIYVIESASVIIQVISFQTRGKRIFLMSPIHHHFEKKGWSEVKIVGIFSLITAVCVAIAYLIS